MRPLKLLWEQAITQEFARQREAEDHPRTLAALADAVSGDIYLGTWLKHPYPGDLLNQWSRPLEKTGGLDGCAIEPGGGIVTDWALAVRDASDPNMSRTRRRAAGRKASDLQPEACAAWDQFRTDLDAWADDARPWIEGIKQVEQPALSAPTSRRNSWR